MLWSYVSSSNFCSLYRHCSWRDVRFRDGLPVLLALLPSPMGPYWICPLPHQWKQRHPHQTLAVVPREALRWSRWGVWTGRTGESTRTQWRKTHKKIESRASQLLRNFQSLYHSWWFTFLTPESLHCALYQSAYDVMVEMNYHYLSLLNHIHIPHIMSHDCT